MKYTQNEKLMQIKNETLIVGVDIGSETHYARAFDYRGIELGRLVIFENSAEGFAKFDRWVAENARLHGKKEVIVGMEPTGHYWFSLGFHLLEGQVKIALVNPFHVKRTKELDDNSPTKNDRKDPKTIAMLVKDGRYLEPYLPEGVYRELRVAMEVYDRHVKRLCEINNKVRRWLHIYFPEFVQVFKDWRGKAALLTLKSFPTPQKVLETGLEGIVSCWKAEIKRGIGFKHAIRLQEAAKRSIGVKEGLRAATSEIQMLLEEYEMVSRQMATNMELVKELLMQVPNAQKILAIKGIGVVAVARFIASVGEIKRFAHPRQIQKLGGLNLKETSSGKRKGKTTLSKRGRKDLRRGLFQAVMPLVAKNPEFRELHKYYTTREKNPLTKMQSLMALCCKLIRIFYALLTKGTTYDPQKMLSDIRRPKMLVA